MTATRTLPVSSVAGRFVSSIAELSETRFAEPERVGELLATAEDISPSAVSQRVRADGLAVILRCHGLLKDLP